MSNFSIQVQFDQNGLNQFMASGQTIGLAAQPGSTPVMVQWLAVRPTMMNTIIWGDQYSVYATNSQLVAGARIQPITEMPATLGQQYTFNNGVFQPGPGQSGSYVLVNGDNSIPQLAGGLTLQSNANGMMSNGPILVGQLPPQARVPFQPVSRIQVFASQAGNAAGQVIQPPMNAITLDMSSNPSQTIHWDDAQGRFVPGPLS